MTVYCVIILQHKIIVKDVNLNAKVDVGQNEPLERALRRSRRRSSAKAYLRP
jgi:hypothetical protein